MMHCTLAASLATRSIVRKRVASNRDAFTLLEVVLALAILVGALAVIGELANQGLSSARSAAALADAQLLAESKMAEITAGLVTATSMSGVPMEFDPAWLYSITVEPTLDTGLVAVRLTVYENLPPEQRPTEFTLVRWMADPNIVVADTSTEATQ
jgi:prepilin-type N-terminal cleavage/methylation domain-containing protein